MTERRGPTGDVDEDEATAAVTDLRLARPWPGQAPPAPAVDFAWGIDGRDLLERHIAPTTRLVVEVGTLLGGSARFWCDHCPEAQVICVDPWIDVTRVEDRPFLGEVPELTDFVVGRTDGLYDVFLASNWSLRDRLVPVRAFSPEGLVEVAGFGIEPDVVYIDGSHVYEDVIVDVATSRALFPGAVLCGDDYNWPAVGRAVDHLVARFDDRLHRQGNTWLIERTGTDRRHAARSAVTVGPVEHSWPVRLLQAARGRPANRA